MTATTPSAPSTSTQVDYSELIPNNVGLSNDRRLQRALEAWRPRFLDWWGDMGPVGFQASDVYLRTAISTDREGWANFGYVKMPDYRWGIFLAEAKPDRRIGFGELAGQPVWQEVPGEHRNALRRLIVVQGDTEPASVEQQRQLGKTAPSLYDLRNLLQVNVEEGRHLWAMVYLLHAHFGRDGREEADTLLERQSGDHDRPRILGAFNEPTPDWLSFFLFTYFTDRDGKYQLGAMAESAFDPLARTCDFMLKEEAHHMFVGASAIGRIVARSCELMRTHDADDIRPYGGVPLDMLQRYLNFHFSVSVDLFGSEASTNAASYYTQGLKGRWDEAARNDDHRLLDHTYAIAVRRDAVIARDDVTAVNAVNEMLRDDYTDDCAKGLRRWNSIIREAGFDVELRLPHRGFHRAIGAYSGLHFSPDGVLIAASEWDRQVSQWLPTDEDRTYVGSLMKGVFEPGRMAGWIAAPAAGIHAKAVDYEYVRLA